MKASLASGTNHCVRASLLRAPPSQICSPLPNFPKFSRFSSGYSLQSSSLSPFVDPIQKSSTKYNLVRCRSSMASSFEKGNVNEAPVKVLRRILDSPGVHQGPACFDALSAKLIERAGFQYCISSGMRFFSV